MEVGRTQSQLTLGTLEPDSASAIVLTYIAVFHTPAIVGVTQVTCSLIAFRFRYLVHPPMQVLPCTVQALYLGTVAM